jgi:hypothetical protein
MATRKAAAPVDDGLVDIVEAAQEIFADLRPIDYTEGDLYVRIAKIIESLPDVKPEGDNTFFKYKFITDKQVNGLLRPRLARARIIIIPETVEELECMVLTTAKGGTSYMSRIRVTWRIVDGKNGDTFTGQSLGYGDDSGDKGANKAFTAAFKNFLIKLFQIGGDTDIEEDEAADKRASIRESGARRVDQVTIGEAGVENVERGGKASNATEAQLARVGQYVRDLSLTSEAFATLLRKKTGAALTLGDKPWEDIRKVLEGMSGTQIGKLITELDDLYNTVGSTDDNPPVE